MNQYMLGEPDPVLPCICGHVLIVHGDYVETDIRYEWDEDHQEQVLVEEPYPRPVCYDCGPSDCVFIEMDNLEYLEMKSNGNDKR